MYLVSGGGIDSPTTLNKTRERGRKIVLVLVLSGAVLVIEPDAKNCIHEVEHEHRRKRLSTSTTCYS